MELHYLSDFTNNYTYTKTHKEKLRRSMTKKKKKILSALLCNILFIIINKAKPAQGLYILHWKNCLLTLKMKIPETLKLWSLLQFLCSQYQCISTKLLTDTKKTPWTKATETTGPSFELPRTGIGMMPMVISKAKFKVCYIEKWNYSH